MDQAADNHPKHSTPYHVALERIESLVGFVCPYGFNRETDEELLRARSDVLKAILILRQSSCLEKSAPPAIMGNAFYQED